MRFALWKFRAATVFVLAFFVFGIGHARADTSKIRIEGDALIYDTETPGPDETSGILSDDVEIILTHLRQNDALKTVHINSAGGEVYAASQISDIIIDFELDTHIHGDCDSSCVTVFLAGNNRTMSRGSRIGFHQIFWSAENIAKYYQGEREANGWDTPFDFAAWMYLDTQEEMYAHLKYMIARGVDPAFAIETIRNPQSEMWRPYRRELLAVGVLTQ